MTKEAKAVYEHWAALAITNAGAEWATMSEEDRKLNVIYFQNSAYKQYRISRAESFVPPENVMLEDPQIACHEPERFLDWVFYYRDALIHEETLQKYQPGQFLRHEPPLDVSTVAGGIEAPVRFLIASKNAIPLFPRDPEAIKWRAHEIPANARFKVLDVIRSKLFNQVFLLHIPGKYPETASEEDLKREAGLIEKAKENFRWRRRLPFIRTMYENEWLERTKAPVGIDDLGEFYRFDMPPSSS